MAEAKTLQEQSRENFPGDDLSDEWARKAFMAGAAAAVERAAQWHEAQAVAFRKDRDHYRDMAEKAGELRGGDGHWTTRELHASNSAANHHDYASFIRALLPSEDKKEGG